MSEPKFKAGDLVAVCGYSEDFGWHAIPKAVVEELKIEPCVDCGCTYRYGLDADNFWYCEPHLRHYRDGEYTDPLITSREVSA